MTTKRIVKVVGISILAIIGLVILFFGFIWGSIAWTRYSKKKEAISYQKEVCDTMKTIQGNFPIMVNGFTTKELKKIEFYLKRDQQIIKDSTINFEPKNNFETQDINLPFEEFNIKDVIIVVIKNRTYLLSGYTYSAFFNYGMFGPVGPCHCGTGGYENINGKAAGSGWLLKKEGLLNYQLPPKQKRK